MILLLNRAVLHRQLDSIYCSVDSLGLSLCWCHMMQCFKFQVVFSRAHWLIDISFLQEWRWFWGGPTKKQRELMLNVAGSSFRGTYLQLTICAPTIVSWYDDNGDTKVKYLAFGAWLGQHHITFQDMMMPSCRIMQNHAVRLSIRLGRETHSPCVFF